MDYKEQFKRNKKDYDLRRTYGICLDTYESMLEDQKECCYICGKEPDRLYVDHCHDTGSVRKLLCIKCNTGLGLFNDSIKAMKKAMKHLMEYAHEEV